MRTEQIRADAVAALAHYRVNGHDQRPDAEIDWVIIETQEGVVTATGPLNGGLDGILDYLLGYEDGMMVQLRPLYQAA